MAGLVAFRPLVLRVLTHFTNPYRIKSNPRSWTSLHNFFLKIKILLIIKKLIFTTENLKLYLCFNLFN